ncbi:MAG: hypothetical protein ACRDGL_07495, partial [Candidatus Limnocylindrales bacterium]
MSDPRLDRRGSGATASELLEPAAAELRTAGSTSPRLDAELLLAHAVGTDRTG